MQVSSLIFYAFVAVAGTIVVVACVHGVWRAVGMYRIHRAGPRELAASRHLIWRDPGAIEKLQLRDALRASGANAEDTERFTAALRDRISQLGRIGV